MVELILIVNIPCTRSYVDLMLRNGEEMSVKFPVYFGVRYFYEVSYL
jgi:hypothetical protein